MAYVNAVTFASTNGVKFNYYFVVLLNVGRWIHLCLHARNVVVSETAYGNSEY